ncbi:MAG TPA: transcription-repair coupling factor [Candidatus Dormibacteraeota bacterium]|nr:transcription-repair coupling factor [Candidatus Dormibacteraeota bacterium]
MRPALGSSQRTLLARVGESPLGQALSGWRDRGLGRAQMGGVLHAGTPLIAVLVQRLLGRTVCLLVAEPEAAWQEVATWLGGEEGTSLFPAADTLPFDRVAPASAIVRHRLQTLRDLTSGRGGVVVTSAEAVLRPTLSKEWVGSWLAELKPERELAPERMAQLLLESGYRQESIVARPGDFARRGGIIDCFPLDNRPWRAEWEGNRVAGLWRLDPETQGSRAKLHAVELMPAREFPLDRETLTLAAQRIADWELGELRQDVRERWAADLDMISSGGLPDPIDALGPLLADPTHTLLVHLPEDTVFITEDWARLGRLCSTWLEEVESIRAAEVARGELPKELPLAVAQLEELGGRIRSSDWLDLTREVGGQDHLLSDAAMIAAPAFAGSMEAFQRWADEFRAGEGTVLELGLQESRVTELVEERGLRPTAVESFSAAATPLPTGGLVVGPGDLRSGLILGDAGVAVIADSDLFGSQKRRPSALLRSVHRAESSAAGRLRHAPGSSGDPSVFRFKLEPGDVVVHRDHGLGRFVGMRRVSDGQTEREYMQLEYADGNKLYVPAEHLDRVERYSGGADSSPTLSRLGSGDWERTRRSVRRRIDQIAEDLVELYALRRKAKGHAFPADTHWQQEMEASFPYQETRDQLMVLDDIKRDMESERPMDRLLCGDVGFGKTEIALRAAFKAVEGGQQVAVLVPTTVLAQQHFLTFQDRLTAFPISVEQLSRLRTEDEAKQVMAGLAQGTVDIVIGTHRLLQKDVRFKRLGLVVLDEEQRFGVRQKERLKQLRTSVDILSLSATPIPRTLHMALAGIRDLSVIRTPPEGRLPIRTYVTAKEDGLIQDVIRRELARRGQVYYVHNRVHSMLREVERLRELVPEARLAIAHGQMDERELARVMVAFSQGEVDVLCCTTIIENGLDIPNANTLVVDDASRLGLAQLYQLRGRVGRSGQRAYAYFLYDPTRSLTEQADKRLDVVADLQDLGSGFALALKDLEIRGAGNVLGEAQHGDIAAVGMEMYNHLLHQAVLAAQGEELVESPAQVSVALPLRSLLPPTYIPDERLRLRVYQQLAAATSEAELEETARNLRQRFGPRPSEVENLLVTLRVRLVAAAAGAAAVETDRDWISVRFEPGHGVRLGELVAEMPRIAEASTNRLRLSVAAAGSAWLDLLIGLLRRAGESGAPTAVTHEATP